MYLYLHVPFCRARCIYCDFYVVLEKHSLKQGHQGAFPKALVQEWEGLCARWPVAQGDVLHSIYVGGGTPSLLPAHGYEPLFNVLQETLPWSPEIEVTLELNPTSILERPVDTLERYREMGFNRVSLGVQSLEDDELQKLSRTHRGQGAIDSVEALQKGGFENISVDLMYGIPGQTQDSWRRTVDRVLALQVPHVSMYGLKVEEGTPLSRLAGTGAYPMPDDDETVSMYEWAYDALESAGLLAYEFSNFARPGFQSKHNLNYWNNGAYYALGPGAHGYVNNIRYENIRDLEAYLHHIESARVETPCPPHEAAENALIFGLRKREGVCVEGFERQYGFLLSETLGDWLDQYTQMGLLEYQKGWLRLTRPAIAVSNTLLLEILGRFNAESQASDHPKVAGLME